ncbi:DMT family transporter [Sphingomonas sp.]|uniref:DMT family transporter n=1 Tax=Sphingomonas sp. TaxID=28214 RepID=UPI003B3A7968
MLRFLPIICVFLAGIGVALQTPTNAALARSLGSVLLAALVSFAGGTIILVAAWLLFDRTPLTALRAAPAWTWSGGLYGAFFVACFAFSAPRLGLATALTIAIASQLGMALVLDHFGLLGLRPAPISPLKLLGIVLVLGGVVLVRRG